MCRRDLVVAGDLLGAQVTVQCVAFDADFDHVPRIPGSNRAVFEDQLRELLDAEFLGRQKGRNGWVLSVANHVRLAGENEYLHRPF